MALLGRLGNYKNLGLLIIRVGLGIMFIYHGYPKLTGGPEMWRQIGGAAGAVGINFLPVMWGLFCAITETVGGFLLIIGLAFRPVCLLLIISLTVAACFHLKTAPPMGGFPMATHAIEDAIMFAGLLFIGPGRYSVDGK